MDAPTLASTLTTVLEAAVTVLGLFLAVQAYRGARRHGSTTMRYVAAGIALLTVVPVALTALLSGFALVGDPTALLVVAISYLLGLAALDYAFNYAAP